MTDNARPFPYPILAIIAGPFLSHLAAHRGLGTVGRALVVGLGVLVVAGVVALLVGPRSNRRWLVVLAAGVGAVVGSLLADAVG